MTERDSEPVIQRLLFGERARQHREAAAIEFGDADKQVGGYLGHLSKIENGIVAPKPQLVEAIINLYDVSLQDADELRGLGLDARRRSAPERVSGNLRQYVQLERSAAEIRMVYNEIPGLLQTREYAYAGLSRSPVVPMGEAFSIADAREERGRRIVRPNGAEMWIAVGADALHREVGGKAVLHAQLERLRQVADMRNVRFRVIPWSVGSVPALSCPFTLLYIKPARTVAYVEALTRPDYLKNTGPYVAAFDTAWDLAAPENESLAILDDKIANLT
jgi:hypothetical protein